MIGIVERRVCCCFLISCRCCVGFAKAHLSYKFCVDVEGMSGPIIAEAHRLHRLEEASKKAKPNEPSKTLISELPFDPTIGAEQLAHAKQRIRDQRHRIVSLEGHLEVLNDAMARRQDILDYVKQMILHDSVFMACIPDDAKRADYQKTFMSVLDGDHLHGMSTAVERSLLEEQLNGLREKVRMLDARDATKTKVIREKDQKTSALATERDELLLQISKSKNQYTNLYRVLQETKEDLTGAQDSVAQVKREADMLRRTLDATLADLKHKDQLLATSTAMTQTLQGQLDAMTNQSDAEKRAAAEALRGVVPLGCDIVRSADQAMNATIGSSLWNTFMQVSSDTIDKLVALLQAAAGSPAADQLRNIVKALHVFHSMSRSAAAALAQQQAAHQSSEAEWSMSCDVKSGIVPHSKPSTLVKARELIGQLVGASACSFAPAEKMFQSLLGVIEGLTAAWEASDASHKQEVCALREEVQQLVQNRHPAPVELPPPPAPPNDDSIREIVHEARSLIDGSTAKWFSNKASWSEDFDATIGSVTQLFAQYRMLEKPPVVSSSVLEVIVDVVSRLLNLLKTSKREHQKLQQSLNDEVSAKRERDRPLSPPALRQSNPDPDPPQLLFEIDQSMKMVSVAQAQCVNVEDGAQFLLARAHLEQTIKQAMESFKEVDDTGEVAKVAQRIALSALHCLHEEFHVAEGIWQGLVLVDDPVVVQSIKRGKMKHTTTGNWARILPAVMAAEQTRSKTGATSLSHFVDPPSVVAAPLPQVSIAMSTKSIATQTIPETPVPKAKAITTTEQAIDIVKKAGQWPHVAVIPRASGFDESIQATSQGLRRGTQTPCQLSCGAVEVSTMTDASLLNQYLGMDVAERAAGVKPLTRQRSASVVQIFGSRGELEEVGCIRTEDHSALYRTASSIPTKHRSVSDLTVSASKSLSFARKHSIPALVARERSITVQRDVDDDSVESVVIGSDFGDAVMVADDAPQPQRRGSSTVFTVDFGELPAEAPADFYALLGRRPSSATLDRAGSMPRPSSAKQFSLRERADGVKHIASAIVGRKQSAVAVRNQSIQSVINGGAGENVVPSAVRRSSLRELAATQRQMSAILGGMSRADE